MHQYKDTCVSEKEFGKKIFFANKNVNALPILIS